MWLLKGFCQGCCQSCRQSCRQGRRESFLQLDRSASIPSLKVDLPFLKRKWHFVFTFIVVMNFIFIYYRLFIILIVEEIIQLGLHSWQNYQYDDFYTLYHWREHGLVFSQCTIFHSLVNWLLTVCVFDPQYGLYAKLIKWLKTFNTFAPNVTICNLLRLKNTFLPTPPSFEKN